MRTKAPNTPSVVQEIEHRASHPPSPEEPQTKLQLIPTGSTLFNLALSGRRSGGFGVGKIVNLIGDSSSGKTLLALTMFAEMGRMKRFDGYRFIYDDVEAACEFDLAKMFGPETAARIEPPRMIDGEPDYSDNSTDLQDNILRAIKKGKPFVYVLDSFDAIASKEEVAKANTDMEAREEGKEVKGSYGMEKAKDASRILRIIKKGIKTTGSAVIIISQTRDNIDPFSFQKKSRTGGRALKFYSTHEVWTAVAGKIKIKKMDHDMVVGVKCFIKITKNKLTGEEHEITIPILRGYGIDDLGSCVDFLREWKHWEATKEGVITAPEFGFKGSRAKLLRQIEEKGEEKRLRMIVAELWQEIQAGLQPDRKPKYS